MLTNSQNSALTGLMHGDLRQMKARGKVMIAEALFRSQGDVKNAAEKYLHVGRATLHRYLKDNPDLRELCDKIKTGQKTAAKQIVEKWKRQF